MSAGPGSLGAPGQLAWLTLLSLLSLELLPSGPMAWLLVGSATLCALALRRFRALACATLGGGLFGALALVNMTAWLGAGFAWLAVVAFLPARRQGGPVLALVGGMGVLFPLLLLGGMAAVDADARAALRLGIDIPGTMTDLVRRCAMLLAFAVLAVGVVEWSPSAALAISASSRHQRVALAALASALVAWLALRWWWVASVVGIRTDLLTWSEGPLLVNLLKLRAGAVYYGPVDELNSYSYSPGVELLQYSLLRPFGLELSLRAHRVLGLLWQLGSSAILLSALRARLSGRLSGAGLALLAIAVLGTVSSSLLAPHVHPDHALMVCFSAALWLVLDDSKLDRRRALALVAAPIAATVFKLTGAGVGLGLVAAYAWERDWKRLGLLSLAGAGALGTIPLFDATLGSFSTYAIRLQASHPMEWARAWSIPSTPSGKVWCLSVLLLAARWWFDPRSTVTRAATRAALLTIGIGVTSLFAYVKYGGRENSLLPLALGGLVVIVLCALTDSQAEMGAAAQPSSQLGPVHVGVLSLALLLIATPPFEPLPQVARARLADMHERQVEWLKSGRDRHLRFWSASMAALVDSGERAVPRDAPGSAVELGLGNNPAFQGFAGRMAGGYYDGLTMQSSPFFEARSWRALRPAIEQRYQVVGPPELGGQFPKDRSGYVLLEKAR